MFKEVIAVVLAAGQSRRFNGDKRLSKYGAYTLLQASLIPLFKRFRMVYVVIRPEDDAALLFGSFLPYVHVIRSEHCASGMGHTLADAITAISDVPATACAVCLGDMPELKTTTIQELIGHSTEHNIVRPRYEHKLGHPVLFGKDFWPELRQLTGDVGAKEVIQRYIDNSHIIDVNDEGILFDIDTPIVD